MFFSLIDFRERRKGGERGRKRKRNIGQLPPTRGLNCNLHTYSDWELNCSLLVYGTALQSNKPPGQGNPYGTDSWAASLYGKEDLGSTSLLSLPSPWAAQTPFSLRVQGTVPVGFSGLLILNGNLNQHGQCKRV